VIARVTFDDSAALGWQRAALSSPVSLSPGTTYVVSYLAPRGGYAVTPRYFSTARTSGDLTAPAEGNGRYLYGANGGLPTGSHEASGYFVDVEVAFGAPAPGGEGTPAPSSPPTQPEVNPVPAEPVAPSATGAQPAAGADAVSPTTPVSVTLQPAPAVAELALTSATGAVAGASTYDVTTGIVTFTPAAPLEWATLYTARITSPSVSAGETWTFTSAPEPVVESAETIFGAATPQNAAWNDPDQVQVATRFTVETAGDARGVRFYKGAANTGTHTGFLWDAAGTAIGTVDFVDETADGWQTARFATPVALERGVEYRVGLFSTTGRYAVDIGSLAQETKVGPFTVPASGSAYTYGTGYPSEISTHNYWVDILFDAG
jgi:hypothetical protein